MWNYDCFNEIRGVLVKQVHTKGKGISVMGVATDFKYRNGVDSSILECFLALYIFNC